MNLLNNIIGKIKYKGDIAYHPNYPYEFCPRCEANITLQKGFDNSLPYWICKGCGEMLINPNVPGDIAWICDKCESMLNVQQGFNEKCGTWKCTECGFENRINESEVYISDDEYRAALENSYKGMSDEDVIEILRYEDVRIINGRSDIVLVENPETGNLYIKKILKTYDASVYQYLMNHPVPQMPKVFGVYEGDNNLVIIEEYIEGMTLEDVLKEGQISADQALTITRKICNILQHLHGLDTPIIHRDIKPSNIIISTNGEPYLLDINAAKWFDPEKSQDTKLLGTPYFAAPEQFGYGFSASSEKSDIYALGILLNVMITGKIPKDEKASEPVWSIIEKCICLEPDDRYSDSELMDVLNNMLR